MSAASAAALELGPYKIMADARQNEGVRVNEEALEFLRSRASRDDYRSMARLAKALYERGANPREVLQSCFGVALPEEFFLIAELGPQALKLPARFTNQPWKLAIPLDRGGPPPTPNAMDKTERGVIARDDTLIPLARLLNPDARHGGSIICYHLKELLSGRSTIVGRKVRTDPEGDTVRYGDSLLTVLHEHYSNTREQLHQQMRRPSNRGAGAVDEAEVQEVEALVRTIERCQQGLRESGSS